MRLFGDHPKEPHSGGNMVALKFTGFIGNNWNDCTLNGTNVSASNWTGGAFPTAADDAEIGGIGQAFDVVITDNHLNHFDNIKDEVNNLAVRASSSLTQYSGPL